MTIRRSMMLLERQRLLTLLMEAREDGLIKRFVPIIVKNFDKLARCMINMQQVRLGELPEWYSQIIPGDARESTMLAMKAETAIRHILAADPDPKKSYATWMCTMFCRADLMIEDLPRFTDQLAHYIECKRAGLIPRAHDLGSIKKPTELDTLLEPFQKSASGTQIVDQNYEKQMFAQSQVVLNTSRYLMLIPKTMEAAQWFGRDTEWCTAWGGEHGRHPTKGCLWNSYKNDVLYILRDNETGGLWQFHRASGQYMDVNDRRIDLGRFSQEHPEITKWFIDKDLQGREPYGELAGRPIFKTGEPGQPDTYTIGGAFGLGSKTVELQIRLVGNGDGGPFKNIITGMGIDYSFRQEIERSEGSFNQFIDFLNDLKIGTNNDLPEELKSMDLTYLRGKGIGRFRDLAPQICKNDTTEWRGGPGLYKLYSLEPQEDGSLDPDVLGQLRRDHYDNGYHVLSAHADLANWNYSGPKLISEFAALLYKINDPEIMLVDTDRCQVFLDPESSEDQIIYDHMVKMFPGVINCLQDHQANGDSPRWRKRFIKDFVNYTSFGTKPQIITEKMISVKQFKNVTEAIEEIGTESAKNALSYMNEGDHYGSDYVDVSYHQSDLFKSLNPALSQKVLAYICAEADDEDVNIEDYDSAEDAYDELGNDIIEECLRHAAGNGETTGAENEASEAVWEAVKSAGFIFSSDGFKTYSDESMHDTPCMIMADIDDLVKFFIQGDPDGEIWDNLNIFEEVESLNFNIPEPYHGWHGYCDETAKESFENQLYDNGITED